MDIDDVRWGRWRSRPRSSLASAASPDPVTVHAPPRPLPAPQRCPVGTPAAAPTSVLAPEGDPPDFDDKVQEIAAMGFPVGDAQNALRQCKYDIGYAVHKILADQDSGAAVLPPAPAAAPPPSSQGDDPMIPDKLVQDTMGGYSPEEHAAVQRLVGMGYDTAWVVQLFNACDRNEQATADLLRGMQ
jgi:hypothetical protein